LLQVAGEKPVLMRLPAAWTRWTVYIVCQAHYFSITLLDTKGLFPRM
jgi:hypothetical protein